MGKFRCLSCKSEFELDEKTSSMRCQRCGSRFLEVIEAENRKRGKSWSAKSFSVGKSTK
ncbi:MAG: hydrogenase expression protein HypA/HybF [Synergistetes bacterium HGW-Synergistetes-2]|nr:MAG: hydrogenase expression protein HypA/HybF [Synergistetes bacterium HGW-Synergistetes-2]